MKKVIIIILFLAMLPLCVYGEENKIFYRESIAAREFTLLDEHDRRRASLMMYKGFPGFFLFPRKGKSKVTIGLPDDKPFISLSSISGASVLVVVDNVAPRLSIYNRFGFKVASLTIGRDGLAKIELLKKPKFSDKKYSKQKGEMKKITKKEFLDFFKGCQRCPKEVKKLRRKRLNLFLIGCKLALSKRHPN